MKLSHSILSYSAIALAALLQFTGAAARAEMQSAPLSAALPANARLAICGDSLTEEMLYTKYVEMYIRACAGRNDVSCFQFGWGGENSGQFHTRIVRGDLDAFLPTNVTFLYGVNDIGGMAWDENWMTAMWNNRLGSILTALTNKYPGIVPRSVICAPTYLDTHSPNGNPLHDNNTNPSLGRLRDLAIPVARANGMGFADVRQRMLESGIAARAAIPGYYFGGNDGAHSGPNGQLMVAHEILKSLNFDGAIATISVDMAGSTTASTGHTIVSAKNGVVVVSSARYPFCYNYDGSTAMDRIATALPFLPFSRELNRFMLVVTNLGQPYANVTWGDTTLTFSREDLEAGVNLAEKFQHTPFDSKFADVMALITKKELKECSMIKGVNGSADYSGGHYWTEQDVTDRNAMDLEVKNAIVPVQHTLTIVPASKGMAPAISTPPPA